MPCMRIRARELRNDFGGLRGERNRDEDDDEDEELEEDTEDESEEHLSERIAEEGRFRSWQRETPERAKTTG